ncbi:MAG: vWA domain-containing protein [Candidatus Eutrophobiaceae bacterium]
MSFELHEFFQGFHFLRPWVWLALPMLAALVWLLHTRWHHCSDWLEVCDRALLPYVLTGEASQGQRWIAWGVGVAGLLTLLALSGPAWRELPQPVFRGDGSLVLVLDLSPSMDATDVAPSRLQATRYKIEDLLKMRSGGQTALIVYAGEPFTVVPLSDDVQTIILQLSALEPSLMPSQGKDTGAALSHVRDLLRQTSVGTGHVLLISDSLGGTDAVSEARQLRMDGHRLSVMGVGTEQGTPVSLPDGGFLKDERGAILIATLDELALRDLAAEGGGLYVRMNWSGGDVASLAQFFKHTEEYAQVEEQAQRQADRWIDEGYWLLFAILPFALWAFRRGVFLSIFAVACIGVGHVQPTQAIEWEDAFIKRDRRAHDMLDRGELAEAARAFDDPEWRASAYYQASEYQKALDAARDPQTARQWYNQGNALSRLGRYELAIDAYREAIALEPDHEDARHNLGVVAEALRKQQEQQEQQAQEEGQGQQGQGQQGQEQQQEGEGQGQQAQGQQGEQNENKAGQEEEAPGAEEAMAQQGGEDDGEQAAEEEQQRRTMDKPGGERGEEEVYGEDKIFAQNDTKTEHEQAMQQWLLRIPDDPAKFLRRKFQYEKQLREQGVRR